MGLKMTQFFILLCLLMTKISSLAADNPRVEYRSANFSVVFEGVLVANANYERFTRIPYAMAPIDALRFRPPQSIVYEGFDNLVDATANQTSKCPQQYTVHEDQGAAYSGEEDCLHLNIFRPISASSTSPMPVVVFLHGGGFLVGNADIDYYGPDLLINENIIVVTLNYRLSSLGFLNLGPGSGATGNQGLKDQRLALQWIQQYISAFGGDKYRVMLLGQSAGGVAVQAHLATNSPKLFSSAMVMSGVLAPSQQLLTLRNGRVERSSQKLAQRLHCFSNDTSEVVECLQKVDLQEMFANMDTFHPLRVLDILEHSRTEEIMMFVPTLDSDSSHAFFEADPIDLIKSEHFQSVPQIMGFTTDDAGLFVPGLAKNNWTIANGNLIDTLASVVLMLDQQNLDADSKMRAELAARHYLGLNMTLSNQRALNLSQMLSDALFMSPMVESAKLFLNQGHSQVYIYELSHRLSFGNFDALGFPQYLKDLRALHSDDLLLIFAVTTDGVQVRHLNKASGDLNAANVLLRAVANMAHTGKPGDDSLEWPSFDVEEQSYLEISSSPVIKRGLHPLRNFLWNKILWRDVVHQQKTDQTILINRIQTSLNTNSQLIDAPDEINQSIKRKYNKCLHFDLPHVHGPCRPDNRPVGCHCRLWEEIEHQHHHCPHLHDTKEEPRKSNYLGIQGYERCLGVDADNKLYCLPFEKPQSCSEGTWNEIVDKFEDAVPSYHSLYSNIPEEEIKLQ